MEQGQLNTDRATETLPAPGPPVGPVKRKSMRWIGWIVVGTLALVLGLGISLTFNWFINPATEEIGTVQPRDAVVLFAGSSERLDTAIELMERGVAPNLVLPNGMDIDDGEDLCEGGASYQVFCPATATIDTQGEAQTIGRLAEEQGWSRLIAVTSVYHVHRATYLLGRCHEGEIAAVTPSQDLDREDWVGKVPHEWLGFLAAVVLQPAC